jgi:hypothetical protein
VSRGVRRNALVKVSPSDAKKNTQVCSASRRKRFSVNDLRSPISERGDRPAVERLPHRLDCFLYSLPALAMSRLKIDECAFQRTEAKNVGKEPEKKEQPVTWGVVSRIPLPSDTDRWQQALISLPEDNPRSRWGVQNRAVEW